MPLKIGHRGTPYEFPENTISSFRKAIALGADGVELDVHLCKSGEPVVIHDDTVDRTTNGKGRIAELTLAELRRLHIAGSEHIPTLAEVFEAMGDIHYFVEVKAAAAALPSAQLIHSYIKKGWHAQRVSLISFNHGALRDALVEYPMLHTGASFEEMKHEYITQTREIGAHSIIPHYRSITQQHVQAAHHAHLSVVVWTVNEPQDIKAMTDMEVDAIISDYPGRLT